MSPKTISALRLLLGVPVVGFFCVLTSIAVGNGLELNRAAQATLLWNTADADIESLSIDPVDAEKPPSVYYRFTAGGRQWSSMRLYPEGIDVEGAVHSAEELRSLFRSGSKAPVHYDPVNPSRCALLLVQPTWLRVNFLLAALSAFVALAVTLRLVNGYVARSAA